MTCRLTSISGPILALAWTLLSSTAWAQNPEGGDDTTQGGGDATLGGDPLGAPADSAVTETTAEQDTSATASASMDAEASTDDFDLETSGTGGLFDAYSVRVGLESAGPVHFKDTPDGQLDPTTVFQYGGHLAFVLGNDLVDVHRFGLGFGFDRVASSSKRSLNFMTPYLMYETGHPLVLQAQVGATLALGSKGFAGNYGGFYSGLALGYSFLREAHWSPISVTPSLVARSTLSIKSMQYSSFFLGAQVEVAYNVK